MRTSEQACLDALREAAEQLGESPTKAEYDELDITPASTTIMRLFDGWNSAKQAAGLETYEQGENGGTDVQPKPDWVTLPNDEDWEELTGQQRWYYKNRQHRIAVKERRRQSLHRWLYELKRDELDCQRCSEARPPALDFHHPDEKERSVSEMVNDGYARETIRKEIDSCLVLCANCHREEHYEYPDPATVPESLDVEATSSEVPEHEARQKRRGWLFAYKRESEGCRQCEASDPGCLDFHHEEEKRKGIGRMVSYGYQLSDIRSEITKCILLCANCHRDLHFEPPGQVRDDTHK